MDYFHSIHFYVTPMTTQPGVKEKFLKDLETATAECVKEGMKDLEGRVRRILPIFRCNFAAWGYSKLRIRKNG